MPPLNQRTVIGACPLDCPDACSWVVTLEDDQPVKLRGNPDHPFSRGTLCVKVNPYLEYSRHPDRLLYPQRRVGKKGEGRFERISWDEALTEIADRLQTTIDQHGAEAIWPYSGTGTMGFIQGMNGAGRRLFHSLGTSQHDPTICSISGHVGMSYTTGSAAGMDPEDLRHSGLILLWGTNTIVSNRHLWPFLKEARDRGAPMVVIDPVQTKTAKRADLHIALQPGTDGALALGLMRQLAQIGAIDESYLKTRTLDWKGFYQEVVDTFSLERTAQICGLHPAEIEQLATLIAENQPLGIRLSMGMQRHLGGGQAARVISCLPAVTGDFQRLGGGLCYSTGPTYKFNLDALWGTHLQKQPTRSLAMTRLGHNLLNLNDPPIKTLLMWAANPVVSNPDQNCVRKALSREDLFFVVIENFQTDTADYADILLPSTMQTEHADMHDSFSHLYINWNEPVAPPPGECLSHTEIFRRLAHKLGLNEPELYASDETIAQDALNSDHPAMAGITLETLKEKGWARLNWASPYQPFLEQFFTPSGKFEFRSEKGETDGVGLYPHYTAPVEAAQNGSSAVEDQTFALLAPANNFMLNSMFANSPHHAKSGEPTVIIHPDDASPQGLTDDSRVRVWNERGTFTAHLHVRPEVRPGVAVTTKGHWAKHHGGQTINATVMERDSDMGRGAVYHDNRVRIAQL
ncbi:MAG: molybdopterin-dependent oxidoreductase [Chloroflexota bacterium]